MLLKTKLEADRKRAEKICIASAIWALIGAIGLFSIGEDFGYYMTAIFVFIAVGIWGYRIGDKKKVSIKNTFKYIQMLEKEPTGSIERIAAKCGLPEQVVKEELLDLIQKGYLKEAYIDNEINCIIINDTLNKIVTKEIKMAVVTCKSCKGNNKVIQGVNDYCEYCGSPLEM